MVYGWCMAADIRMVGSRKCEWGLFVQRTMPECGANVGCLSVLGFSWVPSICVLLAGPAPNHCGFIVVMMLTMSHMGTKGCTEI